MRTASLNWMASLLGFSGLGGMMSMADAQSAAPIQGPAGTPELVAAAKADGMLAKVVYVVFTRGVDPAKTPKNVDTQAALKQHIEYQKKLEKDGILFAAGPFSSNDVPAQGLIMIRAGSEAQARAIADADPMHKLGLRIYTLGRWQIHEGTMSVRVNFSNGTYELE
jgi:uncharacterized protein